MDSNILQKTCKEILARGNIVDGLFIASATNISFDWESKNQTDDPSTEFFEKLDGGILDGNILIMDINYIEFRGIIKRAEEVEEIAENSGKNKLKIIFPALYITCKVSEISDIFGDTTSD